jgi:hypothetical protein
MRTYFLAFLLLPIAVAYISRVIPPLDGIYFLWQFSKVPYVATVVLLASFIWRAKTSSQVILLSIFAPLLMSVLELIFIIAIDPPELRSMARVFQLFGSVVPLTFIVSSVFVGLSWGFFALARKLHWVKVLP